MAGYELIILLSTSLKPKEAKLLWGKIEAYLKGMGLVVKKKNDLGVKQLAYPIKKQKEAVFFQVFLEGGEVLFDEFNVFLNREKELLRYLLLKNKEI